jgi:MFS family permease
MLTKTESILLWSSNLWGLGMGMLGPLYAVFALEIGGNVLDITWVYAVYLMFMGVGVIVVGKIADTVGHEKLLVAGYGLSAVATFGYLLVNSIVGLLIVQILIAIAIALSEPNWFALYDRHSGDGKNDGFVWGLSSGLWYIFNGIAILIGGYIVTIHSFDALFIVMGIVLTLSTLQQARILKK